MCKNLSNGSIKIDMHRTFYYYGDDNNEKIMMDLMKSKNFCRERKLLSSDFTQCF